MNLSKLAIERPVFMTCVLLLLIVLGLFSFKKLPIELFPDVTFPVVTVTTPYLGAGPKEVELLVSKPIEEEIGTISGLKTVRSSNKEGMSLVIAEFTLETDVKYAEQQVRDKVASARIKLPDEVKESTIRKIDPSDQPIMMVTLQADMAPAPLYDLAKEVIKPKLEQVTGVGVVDILGGRKREIHVELDRNKLARAQLSVSGVATRLGASGQNIPAGSVSRENQGKDMIFRTVGEFESVSAIENATVNFFGNELPITLKSLGTVRDTLEDPTTYTYFNGEPALTLYIYKQSGSNTVSVSNAIKKRVEAIDADIKNKYKEAKPQFKVVSNQARYVGLNVVDVLEAIGIGIFLTIIVVYFFLGNMRSTMITGIAIPVSLIGAGALMMWAGFTINIMSLLAFSLAVGLLIDDAIVVRENIFRHMELGKPPRKAALEGTLEVTMAVIAVTLTIVAVFGPIGFLSGVVGQFFKQFGLTVVFIMLISLFDALTNAPMMSAYFGGVAHNEPTTGFIGMMRIPVRAFNKFQTWLEQQYTVLLQFLVRKPYVALIGAIVMVLSSFVFLKMVPKTFLPAQDSGEFSVGLDMPPGTSLEKMRDLALEVNKVIKADPDVVNTMLVTGNKMGEKNKAEFYVSLVPFGTRAASTSDVKARMREALVKFKEANPKVKDVDYVGGGLRPFTMNIIGQDLEQVEKVASQLLEKLKPHPALLDVDTSFRPGKPEFQVQVDLKPAQQLGITSARVGQELRAQVEGVTPAVFREKGLEYDIRVRLQPDQRDLESEYPRILVPNLNERLVSLDQVAKGVSTTGPASIDREDRGRYIQISADIAPKGPGLGGAINDINNWLSSEIQMPDGVSYKFVGQAQDFQDLMTSMLTAMGLGLIFIYLVLSSLYESFLTPFTIMLVIPLAACGAFFALWIGGSQIDLYSMIGCVMLMGLATKNSIILVDYINHLIAEGKSETEAIIEAGRVRLRPILMTSFALVAGMIPVAIGLNEVSNQRTSLGITVIGGVISSTLLTLLVIPSVFSYMERFKRRMVSIGSRLTTKG